MTRSAPSWCKSRGSGATVVTRRILEVEARWRCRGGGVSSALPLLRFRTRRARRLRSSRPRRIRPSSSVFDVAPARPSAVRGATSIPFSLVSVNQPPLRLACRRSAGPAHVRERVRSSRTDRGPGGSWSFSQLPPGTVVARSEYFGPRSPFGRATHRVWLPGRTRPGRSPRPRRSSSSASRPSRSR